MKTWREDNLIYNMKDRMYEDNTDILISSPPEDKIADYIDESLEKSLRKVIKSYEAQGKRFESNAERDAFIKSVIEKAYDYFLDEDFGRIETLEDAQSLDYENIVKDVLVNDFSWVDLD